MLSAIDSGDVQDQFTAALHAARAGYTAKSRKALLQEPTPSPDSEVNLDNPSAFESVLKTVGLGGYGVRNLLKGNVEGTGRNLVDLLSSPIRALLPGDQSSWELSRKKDLPEFSDVLGGMEPGLKKTAVDVVGSILTDPVSAVGVGVAGGIGRGAAKAAVAAKGGKTALGLGVPFMKPLVEIPGSAKGIEMLGQGVKAITPPVVADAAAKAGFALRKTFSALKPSQQVAENVAAGEALGQTTRLAAQTFPVEAFGAVDPDTQRRSIELLRGVSSELGNGYTDLAIESTKEFLTKPEQMALIEQRLAKMPWDEATKAQVRETTEKIVDYTRGLFGQSVTDKVFSLPAGIADDVAPADYFPGRYDVPAAQTGAPQVARAGQPNLIKGAKIKTSKELVDYLTSTGGKLETDLPKILGEYGEQMGTAAGRAALGTKTLGPAFQALSDPASREAMTGVIESLRSAGDLDSAHVLETAFKGLPPPSPFMQTLAKINQPFKAAATAGVLIPNLNFTIGNTISNVVQAAQNPEARGIALKQLASLPKVIGGSIADGLKRIGVSAFPESDFEQVIKAAKRSGGRRDQMLRMIENPRLKEAVEHGVLDGGFVSTEQLATEFAKKGTPKNWRNLAYWTQDIARASEQRMRFGMFRDLRDAGKAPAEAAKIVNDTLFDYKYSSTANRNLRQVIPFGQYTFKAIPQTAKFLAEKPAAMAAIRPLYTQDDPNTNPLPPWTQGNINIPLGRGETGNPQYLSSLRLPFEQLANIPNPSTDLNTMLAQARSDIGGQLSPAIKTAVGALGGTDMRTGQPFMSYDRTPALFQAMGAPEHSEGARLYNALASTGTIQPLASPVANLSKLLDQRQSVPMAALNSLTGLKVIDVDEQQALKQIVEDAIRRDPSIKTTVSYYQLAKTPEGMQLLEKLQEVRKAIKAQRQQ